MTVLRIMEYCKSRRLIPFRFTIYTKFYISTTDPTMRQVLLLTIVIVLFLTCVYFFMPSRAKSVFFDHDALVKQIQSDQLKLYLRSARQMQLQRADVDATGTIKHRTILIKNPDTIRRIVDAIPSSLTLKKYDKVPSVLVTGSVSQIDFTDLECSIFPMSDYFMFVIQIDEQQTVRYVSHERWNHQVLHSVIPQK
jgi:hypothetical protein